MSQKPDQTEIDKFLERVIEIEESPAFMRGGQESARRDKILEALEDITE